MVIDLLRPEPFLPNNLSRSRVEFLPTESSTDQQVRQVACDGFSLNNITSIMRIGNAGILSANYLVEAENRRLVLKARLSGNGVSVRLSQEIALAARLKAAGLPVPQALLTPQGKCVYELFGSVWACFQYCTGNYFQGHLGELEASAISYAALAFALREDSPRLGKFSEGKLIADLATLVLTTTNPPDYDPVMATLYRRHREELLQVIDLVTLKQEFLEAQCQLMHTDFHPLNVLMENGRVSAILDFEDVKLYPVAAASGFAAYKLIRQSLVGMPVAGRMREAERLVDCWLTEWSRLMASQTLNRHALGEGALYRVLGLLHVMLDAWLRSGDNRFNFDFQKQMDSLREIGIIFDLRWCPGEQ